MGKRKGAWRFSAVWAFPGHMVATSSTDPILLQNELRQMETEMKRLVLQAERFPPNLRNIELKYRLSDWELARTKIPMLLPVQGYIQSRKKYSIDFDQLNRWFNANWSPVENQLRGTQPIWFGPQPARLSYPVYPARQPGPSPAPAPTSPFPCVRWPNPAPAASGPAQLHPPAHAHIHRPTSTGPDPVYPACQLGLATTPHSS